MRRQIYCNTNNILFLLWYNYIWSAPIYYLLIEMLALQVKNIVAFSSVVGVDTEHVAGTSMSIPSLYSNQQVTPYNNLGKSKIVFWEIQVFWVRVILDDLKLHYFALRRLSWNQICLKLIIKFAKCKFLTCACSNTAYIADLLAEITPQS